MAKPTHALLQMMLKVFASFSGVAQLLLYCRCIKWHARGVCMGKETDHRQLTQIIRLPQPRTTHAPQDASDLHLGVRSTSVSTAHQELPLKAFSIESATASIPQEYAD